MKAGRVRGHHSKEERWRVGSKRKAISTETSSERSEREVCSPYRVKRRKWTVNSSPHGHKKARDAMGREEWKRKRVCSVGACTLRKAREEGKGVSKERSNGARTGVVVKRRREG